MTNASRPPASMHAALSPRLLPFQEVRAQVSLCRTSIYGLISQGAFPKPTKIGRASRWLSTEIDDWVVDLADRRTSD